MKKWFFLTLVVILLAGCGAAPDAATPARESGMGSGMGMGMGGGMYERHHAEVPAVYASLKSPAQDETALTHGETLYSTQCASCHGAGGFGDGPAASALDPAPSPIAHTSQMMGDGYLVWRISEGGAPFQSAMPAWKETLSQDDIWALIAYIRALGQGTAGPEFEARQHEQMLSAALEQGVITPADADTFTLVHDALNQYKLEHPGDPSADHDAERERMLGEMVAAGTVTQAQADSFSETHQKLIDAGLMQ